MSSAASSDVQRGVRRECRVCSAVEGFNHLLSCQVTRGWPEQQRRVLVKLDLLGCALALGFFLSSQSKSSAMQKEKQCNNIHLLLLKLVFENNYCQEFPGSSCRSASPALPVIRAAGLSPGHTGAKPQPGLRRPKQPNDISAAGGGSSAL